MSYVHPDLVRIQAAMRRTARTTNLLAAFFVGLGVLSLALYGRRALDLGLTMFGLSAGMAGLIYWMGSRASPRGNAAARAVVDEPYLVTVIEHHVSTSSSGGMKLQWLRVKASGKSFGMRVPAAELLELAGALAPLPERRDRRARLHRPASGGQLAWVSRQTGSWPIFGP